MSTNELIIIGFIGIAVLMIILYAKLDSRLFDIEIKLKDVLEYVKRIPFKFDENWDNVFFHKLPDIDFKLKNVYDYAKRIPFNFDKEWDDFYYHQLFDLNSKKDKAVNELRELRDIFPIHLPNTYDYSSLSLEMIEIKDKIGAINENTNGLHNKMSEVSTDVRKLILRTNRRKNI